MNAMIVPEGRVLAAMGADELVQLFEDCIHGWSEWGSPRRTEVDRVRAEVLRRLGGDRASEESGE